MGLGEPIMNNKIYDIFKMSYILLVYADKERTVLIGYRLFLKIKDCMNWTNNLINYADLNKDIGYYHTYKSYLALLKLTSYQEWRYFHWKDLVQKKVLANK